MLPALFGLFVAAACSLVERALCPIAQTWLARRMSAPLRFWSRSPPSHPSSLRSLSCLARLAPRRLRTLATPRNPPSRPSACDLRRARHACPAPRCPHRTRIGELEDAKREARTPLPTPHPHPAMPRAPLPTSHPPMPRRPATRRTSLAGAGPAAVPAIPAKWCGDTIAHTRKLRF